MEFQQRRITCFLRQFERNRGQIYWELLRIQKKCLALKELELKNNLVDGFIFPSWRCIRYETTVLQCQIEEMLKDIQHEDKSNEVQSLLKFRNSFSHVCAPLSLGARLRRCLSYCDFFYCTINLKVKCSVG